MTTMVQTAPWRVRCAEAKPVIAAAAEEVDRSNTFPAESIAALAATGLLHAVRDGLPTTELAMIARILGRSCGSTAMIWAMHQVQLACVRRHLGGQDALATVLERCVAEDRLIASVTSERGVGGDLRTSRTCCQASNGVVSLVKQAPTVSYGLEAGAFLVTARRAEESPPGDQVAVLALREQVTLTDVGAWQTMGMRGTRSPGCVVALDVPAHQVLTVPFGLIASRTMVPLSHILWSSVWLGIAESAMAAAIARARAGLRDGHPPDDRLAGMAARLSLVDGLLAKVIAGFDRLDADETREPTVEFGVEVNNLKLAASTEALRVAETALEVCGMAGYAETGTLSVSRMIRDLHSARLMIANSRLAEVNAAALLARRYD